MYECTNCNWKGHELSKRPNDRHDGKCPVCGDDVSVMEQVQVSEPVVTIPDDGMTEPVIESESVPDIGSTPDNEPEPESEPVWDQIHTVESKRRSRRRRN